MKRLLVAAAGCLLWGASGGCSLTIDREGLAGPDLHCSEVEKECEVDEALACVAVSNPDYGCSSETCAPCYLHKATATCAPHGGACIVAACVGSWENCDRTDDNGCEVDLSTDPDHCGGCGKECEDVPHAEVRCGSAQCYIRVCEDGFLDCNDSVADGCETDLSEEPEGCEPEP